MLKDVGVYLCVWYSVSVFSKTEIIFERLGQIFEFEISEGALSGLLLFF